MVSTLVILPLIIFGVSVFKMNDAGVVVTMEDRREQDTVLYQPYALSVGCDEIDSPIYEEHYYSVEYLDSTDERPNRVKRELAVLANNKSGSFNESNKQLDQRDEANRENQTAQKGQEELKRGEDINQTQVVRSAKQTELDQQNQRVHLTNEMKATSQNQIDTVLEGLNEVNEMCIDILEETELIFNELEELKQGQPKTLFSNCSVYVNCSSSQ